MLLRYTAIVRATVGAAAIALSKLKIRRKYLHNSVTPFFITMFCNNKLHLVIILLYKNDLKYFLWTCFHIFRLILICKIIRYWYLFVITFKLG